MKLEKIKELIAKCESLNESLEVAQEEAIGIQKTLGTENLDVMHIGQAREIVSMRIGYLNRQVEIAETKAATEKAAAEKAKEEPPK